MENDNKSEVQNLRLKEEESLRKNEELLRTITENAPDIIVELDRNGTILYLSRVLPGYKMEEVIGKNFVEWTLPEYRVEMLNTLERVFSTGTNQLFDSCGYGSDRDIRWYRSSFAPVKGADGTVQNSIMIARDITEVRQKDQQLRESEERYKSLFQNNHSVMLLIHPETGEIVDANPAACRFYGWTQAEICTRKISDINTLTEHEVAEELQNAKKEQRNHFFFRHRLATNEIRDVEVFSSPIRFGDNTLLYSLIHDITDRKKAEEALLQSETLLSGIINSVNESIWLFDKEGKILMANNTAISRFDFPREEIIGKYFVNYVSGELGTLRMEKLNQVFNTGESLVFEDERAGINFEHTFYPVNNFNGKIESVASFSRNITERKEFENKLRQSEEKFRNLVWDMQIGVLLQGPSSEILMSNPKALDLLGLTQDQLLGKAPLDPDWIPIHEDGSPFPGEMLPAAQVIATGKAVKNIVIGVYQRLRGEHVWFLINAQPQLDEKGKLIQVVTTFVEITDLREAQRDLKESELRLKYHFENSPLGVVEWDKNFVITHWSVEAERIFGFTKEETIGKPIGDLNLIYEEDFPMVNQTMFGITSGQEDKVVSANRNITKSGSIITTIWYNSILFDENKKMKSVMSLVEDITSKKTAEDALIESEQSVRLKLQSILSPEGNIADLDLNDIIDAPAIQKLMDSFHELAQVPMAIIDIRGEVLVGIGWQDICTKFHRVHPKACRNCFESDVHLTAGIPDGEFMLYKCKNNMWDMATPIIIGGEHKGNLYLGQFFFDNEPVNDELFRKQANEYGFEEKEYMEALHKVPRLSKEKLESSKSFFLNLSRSISELSYSNIKLARAIAQQKKVEETLREKDELLNKAHQIAHLGSWSLDVISKKLIWSDEIYRIFGLEPNEFQATYEGFLNAVHPDDREAVHLAYTNSIREGKDNYEIEHRIVRKSSGELRHVYEKCEHIKDPSGKIIQSIGMVHDITERKVKEKTMHKLNQTLLALSKTNQAMSQLEDENEYLKQVCKIIVEDTDFSMVWIGYAENDEAKTIRPMASAGFKTDYVEKIHVTWDDSEFGRGPTGTAIRTGNMSMCNNMFTDPAFEPWREQAIKHGFSSSIVFPLKAGETVFGAISIYSKHPESFLDVEINMLLELAGDLAQGISNIRLRAAHKLAEKSLSESHNELEVLVKQRTRELQITNNILKKEINFRKQQEQNLKLTEEKYRTVADYNYDWETWLGPDGKFVYVSPSCESITGYTVSEFMKDATLFFKITHPDDLEMVKKHAIESIKGIIADCSKDFRIITKNGEERWIGHNCQPVYNANGEFIGQRGSNRDITQRKKTEKILIDSQTHLRELTQRMDIITEEERIRIAREIHDELGHLLTALKYDVEGLINNTHLSEDLIKSELNGMISMIEALIDSVRKIATELRPGILDHLGLFPAIEWKISQFKMKNKISCEYTISEFEIDFDKNETTIIYRILQEIFTNITRHSKAQKVWVSIDKEDDYFVLKVVDDGIGFQINVDSQSGSLGLMGMRERAMSIGGEIQIESEPGNGTTVMFLLKK